MRSQRQSLRGAFSVLPSKVAKIAILAGNAVRNADPYRTLELIEEIRVMCEYVVIPEAAFEIVRRPT
jgi:hypothetical protein